MTGKAAAGNIKAGSVIVLALVAAFAAAGPASAQVVGTATAVNPSTEPELGANAATNIIMQSTQRGTATTPPPPPEDDFNFVGTHSR